MLQSMNSRRSVGISIVIVALALASVGLHAQNRYEWKVYSAVTSIRAASFAADGTLWAATTGGLLGFDLQSNSFNYVRTTEGLLRLNSSALAVAPDGALYVGSESGSISIRTPDGVWHYATEITAETDRPVRRVTGFAFHDSVVYVLTSFGVSVYHPADSAFIESYLRLGGIPTNTSVNDMLIHGDSIWLATDGGVAVAPLHGVNLAAPQAWRVVPSPVSTPVRAVSIASIDGRPVIATDSGTYDYIDGSLQRRDDLPQREARLTHGGTVVVAASGGDVYRLIGDRFERVDAVLPATVTAVAVDDGGRIAVGFDGRGLGIIDGSTLRLLDPNSAVGNEFASLARAVDGSIWAASGNDGVSRLRDGQWSTFRVGTTEEIRGPARLVSTGGDGAIWVGTFGAGFARFTMQGDSAHAEQITNTNSPLTAVPSIPNYVIGFQAAADEYGRTWLVNWDNTSSTGPVLVARLPDSEVETEDDRWVAFKTGYTRNFKWIAIDQAGTKWLGSDEDRENGIGLMYINDAGTLRDKTDDLIGVLTTRDGLLSNTATALAVDDDNQLWVGSPKGLLYIVDPYSVVFGNASPGIQRVDALSDVPINAIAVDALNHKWIGTDQGVYVLSDDGEKVLEHFTVANSPLADDRVLAVLPIDTTGDIYIGTANGLSVVSTPAVEAPEQPGPMVISPMPFEIPSASPARIAGIPDHAVVKILTPDGRLIRQFDSPGGAVAFWDGLDDDGAPVASGVYVIAAGSTTGESTVVGKIAVIRR